MRVPGYCTSCRRIRQVDATPISFVTPGAISGICHDCREQEDRPFVAVDARGRVLGRAASSERAVWVSQRRGVVVAVEEHARRFPFRTVRRVELEDQP